MTTRTWIGTTGNFTDAGSWSPAGVPISGDVAIINSGSVALASSPSGVTIQLNETSFEPTATVLALNNTILDSSVSLVTDDLNTYNANAPTITVSGSGGFAGVESFFGPKTTFGIATGSTLLNTGTLNFYSSAPLMNGGGTFFNNGVAAILNPGATSQYAVIDDGIAGSGAIALGKYARIELAGPVLSGQTFVFNDGATGNQIAQLDSVGTFQGTFNGFSSSDLIAVTNTPYTGYTYTSTGSNSGTLTLLNGGSTTGAINLVGQYSTSSFNLVYNNFGGGLSNLQISTTAVNAVSSGLPAGFSNGGNGTGGGTGTALPVYRFFDKNTGTHFFTAVAGERDTTKTLSNYVQETNDFGAVAPSDPNSEAVYRFFDTHFGTHFFTASSTERDQVIASRPDLTYEPGSTFYEHATQQAGDVAVYRFFDTQFGTHFYTGDATEATNTANLLLPGTSTHEYTAEGIGFYAPAGSFT